MSLTLAEHHRPNATAGAPTGDKRLGSFTFEDEIEGVDVPLPSVSPRQQETFKALFSCEMKALDAWAAKEGWLLPSPFPTLHIYVSRQYEFAASLWPQWKGQIGRMNFPAYRVAVGEANVLHELVHVYFPNGNRMLAEGLAVHLQQEIGCNAVFQTSARTSTISFGENSNPSCAERSTISISKRSRRFPPRAC